MGTAVLMISTNAQGILSSDWATAAAELSAAIANMPSKFDADTVLYNETSDRLNILLSLFADDVDQLTTVFTCLRERYAALVVSYNQVLADTELSIEEAARIRMLLEGELYALLEETNAQIAQLTAERDELKAERDLLEAAYIEITGDSKAAADDVMLKIRTLSDSYDVMVAAEDAMLNNLSKFKSNIESMFASLHSLSAVASGEICKD
jgi:hypothetical protein